MRLKSTLVLPPTPERQAWGPSNVQSAGCGIVGRDDESLPESFDAAVAAMYCIVYLRLDVLRVVSRCGRL